MTVANKKKPEQWYIKNSSGKFGPVPLSQMLHYIILKRVNPDDEVSRDGVEWHLAKDVGALDPKTAMGVEGLLSDEQRGWLENTQKWLVDHPRVIGIKVEEVEEEESPRDKMMRSVRSYAIVAALLVAVLVTPFFLPESRSIPEPECNAVAADMVNWTGCNKISAQLAAATLSNSILRNVNFRNADLQGADLQNSDLSYADLTSANLQGAKMHGAILKGATLHFADMRNSDLTEADLSYSDLKKARLLGADLQGARFGKALWINGVSCHPGSVNGCAVKK